MDTCLFCGGTLDPTTRRCQQCGQLPSAWSSAPTIPAAGAAANQTRHCPHCAALVPQWMRFCGYCGRPLPQLAEHASDGSSPASAPTLPASPGATNSPPLGATQPLGGQMVGQFPGSDQAGRVPVGTSPALDGPERGASGAPGAWWLGVAGPGVSSAPRKTQHVPLGKKLIAVVAIVVLAVLITVAFAQGGARLSQVSSTSPTPHPGQPAFVTGAPGTISEVPVSALGSGSAFDTITAGPDGNVWFIEQDVKKIGRITPQGIVTEFPVFTTGNSGPISITAGPDSNLWFTMAGGEQIGRITPQGLVTLLPLHNPGSYDPEGIVTGPDGNLWIPETDQILKVTPEGSLTAFPLPEPHPVTAQAITVGPDGNLWFTVKEIANPLRFDIGRITPQGTVTLIPLPPETPPLGGIAKGSDSNLWFTEAGSSGQKIGRITPSGTLTEFPLPNPGGPVDIAAGPDGNLWFTNAAWRNIGRITPEGTFTEFPITNADSDPIAITAGPDGNVWFTDVSGSGNAPMIGRLIVGKAAGSSVRLGVRAATVILDERRAGKTAKTR